MAQVPPFVRVAPSPDRATVFEAKWDKRAEELEFDALANIRGAAEKWTAAIASVLAIFGIVTLVKGPADVQKVAGELWFIPWDAIVGILVALAIAAAVWATILAARAAYGLPVRLRWTGTAVRRESREAAAEGSRDLNDSIGLAIAAVVLLGAATLITWYTTPDEPVAGTDVLVIGAEGVLACGTLVEDIDEFRVKVSGTDKPVPVAPAEIVAMTSVASCAGD